MSTLLDVLNGICIKSYLHQYNYGSRKFAVFTKRQAVEEYYFICNLPVALVANYT